MQPTIIAAAIPNPSFAQRWRKLISIFVAIVWLAAAILCVPRGFDSGWHRLIELVGYFLLIIAAQGRTWAMVYIVGRKSRELCQAGPYSLTRNPLYLFSFIGVLGVSLALQHVLLGLIAATVFLLYYEAVIRGEECILKSIHGAAFTDYCARVPRFWPKLGKPDPGCDTVLLHIGPFVRGLKEVFWFLAAIILIEVLQMARHSYFGGLWELPF